MYIGSGGIAGGIGDDGDIGSGTLGAVTVAPVVVAAGGIGVAGAGIDLGIIADLIDHQATQGAVRGIAGEKPRGGIMPQIVAGIGAAGRSGGNAGGRIDGDRPGRVVR